ncbi:MAG: SPFH domain-containing protein [Ruminococcus sp.]|nr:SPFH domain-containing protein [Ruminococcus sp.]
MGLKQIVKNAVNSAMNTGLGQAAMAAGSGILADQWKEFFYCDTIPSDTLVVKGQKQVKKGVNNKGNDNIITNGSVIVVNEGQCMMIVDQGQPVELCAVPGEFVYDTSTEPTVFSGDFFGSLKDTISVLGRRITFGGETAHDQRIYYFNIKEMMNKKFGTPRPVPFNVVYPSINKSFTVNLRCFGLYSLKVSNPMTLYKLCGNVKDTYKFSEVEEQLKGEINQKLQPAFAKLSQTFQYDKLPGETEAITATMKELLNPFWLEQRGLELVTLAIESVSIPTEDEERIKKYEDLAWNADPRFAAATMVQAQAQAMQDAANNANGAAMGFYGLNMAQQTGGMNAQGLFNMAGGDVPNMGGGAAGMAGMAGMVGAAAAAAASGATWDCSCGKTGNTGKFCAECGKPMPAPAPAADTWSCSCGHTGNTGKFCAECGKPKPADADGWTCECGTVNKGKFCAECGKGKPSDAPKYKCDKCGWEPADPFNPPKFCGECGDPFNDDDIVG